MTHFTREALKKLPDVDYRLIDKYLDQATVHYQALEKAVSMDEVLAARDRWQESVKVLFYALDNALGKSRAR